MAKLRRTAEAKPTVPVDLRLVGPLIVEDWLVPADAVAAIFAEPHGQQLAREILVEPGRLSWFPRWLSWRRRSDAARIARAAGVRANSSRPAFDDEDSFVEEFRRLLQKEISTTSM